MTYSKPPTCQDCGDTIYTAKHDNRVICRTCYDKRQLRAGMKRRGYSSGEIWALEKWQEEETTGVLDVEVGP